MFGPMSSSAARDSRLIAVIKALAHPSRLAIAEAAAAALTELAP